MFYIAGFFLALGIGFLTVTLLGSDKKGPAPAKVAAPAHARVRAPGARGVEGSRPKAGRRDPSPLSPGLFAKTLQGTANAYAAPRHLPLITQVNCVLGNEGHYLCAFIFRLRCMLSSVSNDNGQIKVLSSFGPVAMPRGGCKVRLLLKGAP